jgi:tetratricopeptide (TPR) repeat protein
MWKSFFILLFSLNIFAQEPMDKGDLYYVQGDYLKALDYYYIAYEQKHPKAKLKLIMSYLKLGDNFKRIRSYDKALSWYEKALGLQSNVAKVKISSIYELKGDMNHKIKDYVEAKRNYEKSLQYGNAHVKVKLLKVKKALDHQKKLSDDTRILVDHNAPSWTSSIGRIIVPTYLEHLSSKRYSVKHKKCTATLVNLDESYDSKVVITASHCLSDYDKSTGRISFIIKSKQNDMIQRFAKVYYDSQYNHKNLKSVSDLAILILDKAVQSTEVTPLLFSKESFKALEKQYKYSYASLAGFSSDIGDHGAYLSYDPECSLKNYNKVYGKSTCKGFQGASGGPVILALTNDGKKFDYKIVGVVSHYKNKKFENIYFAPLDLIYNKINEALMNTN